MHRSFLVFAAALILLMAGALFYAARIPVEHAQPVTVAETMDAAADAPVYPSFTLVDLDGNERHFSEWEGKHRLLNFWATWCAPCRREIPLLKTFQDEQRENGFVVIGIAVDFPDQVAAYAEEAKFNYPILVGQEDAMAVAETSGVEFIGMPFTMIVAADGELINTHIGEIMDSHLEQIVRVLTMLDKGEIDKASARKALNFL
ncbi:MAG: redoxin domain-containing protein [Woeseiaceae bacterium]|nr:redoxin domain-containing protein [Woeseiaceae bacterium]